MIQKVSKINIGSRMEHLLRDKSMETKICAYCGGRVVTFASGDGWSVECINCGALFDED